MQLRDRSFGFLPCSLGFLLFRFVVKSGGSSLTAGPGAGLGGTASLDESFYCRCLAVFEPHNLSNSYER